MTGQRIQQEAICYQWSKQQLILSVSEPSISQRSQIKEDTVEPSVLARKFNLKAYAAITWHNDPASPASNPDLPITVARQRVPYREATNSATEAGKWLMTLIISNWHYIMYIYILRPTPAGGPGPQSFIGNLWYTLLFSCKTLRKKFKLVMFSKSYARKQKWVFFSEHCIIPNSCYGNCVAFIKLFNSAKLAVSDKQRITPIHKYDKIFANHNIYYKNCYTYNYNYILMTMNSQIR